MNWDAVRNSPAWAMMKGLGIDETNALPPSQNQGVWSNTLPNDPAQGMSAITGGSFNLGGQNNFADDIKNNNAGGFTTTNQKQQTPGLLNAPQSSNDPLMNQNSMLNEGFWKQLFSMFGGGM